MPIEWRDQLSIDQGVIDQDHKTLIAIINHFEAVKPGPESVAMMEGVLDELGRYADVHFRREERLQQKAAFPGAKAHSEQHRLLMHNLAGARAELTAAASGKDMALFREHMCGFLQDWLLRHIIRTDLMMKPYVQAMAPHAARIESLHAAVREMEW